MSTLRKHVSDVRSSHRLLSGDGRLTDRAIASELKMNSLMLIKRETNLRRLWNTDTIFTTIPCLQMCEVPISECCDYVDECTISRSKFLLPSIAEGIYKYIIQGVYSINAQGGQGKKFTEITINRFLNIKNLRIAKTETYFWIHNNYLYVTNSNLTTVRISALFEQDISNDLMFPDCDCKAAPPKELMCTNPLDKDFFLPGYLEKQVQELTSQKLLSTYFKIKQDITEDQVDGQASNSPNLR